MISFDAKILGHAWGDFWLFYGHPVTTRTSLITLNIFSLSLHSQLFCRHCRITAGVPLLSISCALGHASATH